MAGVQSSRARCYERRTTATDEPTKHLESEGERLIKEMVLKQTGTQINLAEQLQQQQQFEKATELVPLTKYTSGEISLKVFQHAAEKASYIEKLKSAELTDEEIKMVFAHEKGEDYFFSKYHKMERSVLKQKLQEIFAKVEAGKNRLEESEKKQRGSNISRHEQELGLAVKPGSEETKLFMFALSCQQQEIPTDDRPPEHPINHLKELEQQMFGHLTKKKRKKTKNTEPVVAPACSTATAQDCMASAHGQEVSEKKSLWDCKQPVIAPAFNKSRSTKNTEPVVAPACSTATAQDCMASAHGQKVSEKKSLWDCKHPVIAPAFNNSKSTPVQISPPKYTCQPKTLYTIRNGKIVTVTDVPKHTKYEQPSCPGQPFVLRDTTASAQYKILTEEDIMGQRLSMNEIKKIPKFENYEPGMPSKVLFVKNLVKQVTEMDLVSVFAHLEDPGGKRIIYRLMAGKMKGQAFVTFPSIEKATTALETVNGFLLHHQPIVIQYGRSAGLD